MTASRCPDGAFCDGMEVWRYVDPITDETRWSWVCLGLRETFNHATLPLALGAMQGAHSGSTGADA